MLRFQDRIPARDYDVDRSEVEILCRYLNRRAPGDMCRLQYRTDHRCYQASPKFLNMSIMDNSHLSEPALELHSRAAPSVGGIIPAQLVLTQGEISEKGTKKQKNTRKNKKMLLEALSCHFSTK